MSWMDSWSRPSKHAVTPPPLYLTVGDAVPYCHTCGRLIGSRKTNAHSKTREEVKYCSTRCRHSKPGALDRKIERVFVALLNGEFDFLPEDILARVRQSTPDVLEELKAKKEGKGKAKRKAKGDPRVVVQCSEVEELVFWHEKDPDKVFGRKKNRAARGVRDEGEWKSVDMVDGADAEDARRADSVAEALADVSLSDASVHGEQDRAGAVPLPADAEADAYGYGGGKIRPPQEKSDVNGSVGGEKGWAERIEETEDMKAKRREGQRRAEEKEMVKRAARRGCAFGFAVPSPSTKDVKKDANAKDGNQSNEERMKCEAVMKGAAVEASYAKGDWGVRWREKI